MSDQQGAQSADKTSVDAPQTTEPVTPELGDAGKNALRALRNEVKELKAQLKAFESQSDGQRDAESAAGSPSDGTRDAASDADAGQVATTGDGVKPPRFQGTADGGVRTPAGFKQQLTRADLKGMTPAQINEARQNGQLRDLMRGSN